MEEPRQSWLPENAIYIPLRRGPFYLARVIVGLSITSGFLGFFCALAIKNLIDFRGSSIVAIFASVIWILLVALVVGALLVAGGPKPAMVHLLGHFSRKHFVAMIHGEAQRERIGFGFQLFGFEFYRLLADIDGVELIHWSSGQGSHFAKKDIGDWDVAVWVRRESIHGARPPAIGHDVNLIYLVGFCDKREIVERFGRELVEFLRRAGVDLKADESGNKFTVGRSTAEQT